LRNQRRTTKSEEIRIMPHGVNQVGTQQTSHNLAQSQASGPLPPVSGNYKGQTVVQAPSTESLIQSSLEELPANLSSTMSKKLAQRTAKNRSSSRIEEMMRKYLKAVNSVGKAEKFEKLTDSLKQLAKPTPQQVRQFIEEHFGGDEGDVECEAGVLLALEEFFADETGAAPLLQAVREAKTQLAGELNEFHHEQIAQFEGVDDVYASLTGDESADDFMAATGALISRLGNDVHGKGRTMDGPQLKSTLDTLFNLEVARNTFSAFSELAEKMQGFAGAH